MKNQDLKKLNEEFKSNIMYTLIIYKDFSDLLFRKAIKFYLEKNCWVKSHIASLFFRNKI